MRKSKVFIVEDEPLIARLAQVNLEHAGYQVESVHDGMAAWEALESGSVRPDLILTDITLPYMDGFELLRRLKATPDLASIPVVIMTARALDAHIAMATELGADRYMNKPINPTELVETIGSVLGQDA
jgi:DNA-binding response OmpR family regulator